MPLQLPAGHQRLATLIAVALVACTPASKPAGGAVGNAVRVAIEAGSGRFDHSEWDRILARGTKDGLVDYDFMQDHRSELNAYVQGIAIADLESLSRDHLMALLINAYNAYTVISILDQPGIESIREIDGVWDKATHVVGGFDLTLDNIEHNLLRPYFKDPRIHMVVNCASQSCAPLPPWAFDGDRLEQQLEEWTRVFFASPKSLQVEGDTLRVSQLLDWYGADFTAAESAPRADTIADFVARYAPEEARRLIQLRGSSIRIGFLDYDWALNQAE